MHLNTPPDLPPAAGYSHVATVPAGSTLVHTSGQVPMAPGGTIAPAQARSSRSPASSGRSS